MSELIDDDVVHVHGVHDDRGVNVAYACDHDDDRGDHGGDHEVHDRDDHNDVQVQQTRCTGDASVANADVDNGGDDRGGVHDDGGDGVRDAHDDVHGDDAHDADASQLDAFHLILT